MRHSDARRASRGSVKIAAPIPYTSTSPFLINRPSTHNNNNNNNNNNKSNNNSSSSGLLSRVASAVVNKLLNTSSSLLSSSTNSYNSFFKKENEKQQKYKSLQYGDIIRDIPFHIHSRTVAFFSTHPSLSLIKHGQCLHFIQTNETFIIIGARGGCLWGISSEGPITATPLRGFHYNNNNNNNNKTYNNNNNNNNININEEKEELAWEIIEPAVPELITRLREGLEAAVRDAELDYDAEQKEFLQKAPDLFVEVVDDEDELELENNNNNININDNIEMSEFDLEYRTPIERVSSTLTDSTRKKRWRTSQNISNDDTFDENKNNNNINTIEKKKKRKQIILAPQVVQLTGDLGWAGEGVVIINGGGVKSFSASLSASVVL